MTVVNCTSACLFHGWSLEPNSVMWVVHGWVDVSTQA